MEHNEIIFFILATVIVVFSILTVTSRQILRAAACLLTVLMATAGLYLLLHYDFLAAVQLTLYAGGILVLIVFSILLTSHIGQRFEPVPLMKKVAAAVASLSGAILCCLVIAQHEFTATVIAPLDVDMNIIGRALLERGDHGYVLPFEVISVLLLSSMIGSIVIAKKIKTEGK